MSAFLLAILLGSLSSPILSPVTAALAADNPIVVENNQAGSSGWQIGSKVANDTTGQIKGYASSTSVGQNESITLHVTVNPRRPIDF